MKTNKCKVVMLATNKTNNINDIVLCPNTNRLALLNILTYQSTQPSINQHLYIISDDEIKEGDYCIALDTNIVFKVGKSDIKGIDNFKHIYKKVIATTDTSLRIDYNGKTPISQDWGGKVLPQPSQQFIEQYIESYNKGEIITDVLVEYEKNIEMRQGYPKPSTNNNKTKWNYNKIISYNLKINTNNTITIEKLKDSWNKEEIRLLCLNAYYHGGKNATLSEDISFNK